MLESSNPHPDFFLLVWNLYVRSYSRTNLIIACFNKTFNSNTLNRDNSNCLPKGKTFFLFLRRKKNKENKTKNAFPFFQNNPIIRMYMFAFNKNQASEYASFLLNNCLSKAKWKRKMSKWFCSKIREKILVNFAILNFYTFVVWYLYVYNDKKLFYLSVAKMIKTISCICIWWNYQ